MADTAVNLLQDARPQLGDRVIVLGQGILGLLVGGILSEFPLTALYGVDQTSQRRAMGEEITPPPVSTLTALPILMS